MDDRRGVSSVMGVVLLLGITLMVVTVILATSVVVLADAQSDARISQMENSMSQMSSKASLVALGDSDSHQFNLGDVDGAEVELRPEMGNLKIIYEMNESDPITLYDEPLGALVYERGDVEVAYQAGGVWKKQGEWSTMISPPEFHYRSATLTFPIIRVTGDYRESGPVRGTVVTHEDGGAIYPNESASLLNPLTNGTVIVEVESEYYQGWHEFFDQRTEGEIDVDADNKTIRAELRTLSDIGQYSLSDGLKAAGIKEDPGVTAFNITFVRDGVPAGFNPVRISLYSEENTAGEEFEIHIDPHNNDPPKFTIYYRDDDGEEIWEGTADEFEVEGSGWYYELAIDFLSEETNLTYTTSTNADLVATVEDPAENTTIDGVTYEEGDELQLGTIINHYLVNMEGTIDLDHVAQGGQGGPVLINEEASTGTIEYEPDGDIIQYLHVTNQTVEVRPR